MEEYSFWSLAQYFVKEENYRILHISNEHKELWLENPESNNAPIIRLLNCTLDWSRWLERDIQLTGMNGENIRKKRFKKNLHILNIYISPYEPVDDYEHRIIEFSHFDHTDINTLIMSRAVYQKIIEQLEKIFKKKISISFLGEQDISLEKINEMKMNTIQISTNRAQSEKNLYNFGKPIFTYIFIVIQIIMFLLLELNGGSKNSETLIAFGAKYNTLILEGEWWRFITPVFLHIGFLHLFMNTLGLYYLGTAVEKIYGSIRFFWIYLFAGLIGSIASFAFSPNVSAGASGAIYGCFGALLYIGLIYPKLFIRTLGTNVLSILVLNIVISFAVPSIDLVGHLGGLVGGFVATGVVHFPKKKKIVGQLLFFTLSIIIFLSLLFLGYNQTALHNNEDIILQKAQNYAKEGDHNKSYQLLSDYLEENSSQSEYFYFQLSYVEIQLKKLEDAKEHLRKAIEINPDFSEAHFNLALILLQLEQYNAAKEHVQIAVKLDPENKKYQEVLDKIK